MGAQKIQMIPSLITTRSKKKQLVPKLRPRLNGRVSTNTELCHEKHSKSKGNRPNSSQTSLSSVTIGKSRELTDSNTIYINKKKKPTSIENKLKIKFMLQENEINDDLKNLNKIKQYE